MKLLLLTACEKVLQDVQSGHSLISVFHGLTIQLPPEPEMPGNAVIPKEWAIFSKWELLPDEEGKNYASSVEIFWPDGTFFAKSIIAAAQPTQDGMAFIVRLPGFPIGQNGKLKIVQFLQSDDEQVFGPVELEVRVAVTRDLEASESANSN
jgi:hypothetical protein